MRRLQEEEEEEEESLFRGYRQRRERRGAPPAMPRASGPRSHGLLGFRFQEFNIDSPRFPGEPRTVYIIGNLGLSILNSRSFTCLWPLGFTLRGGC